MQTFGFKDQESTVNDYRRLELGIQQGAVGSVMNRSVIILKETAITQLQLSIAFGDVGMVLSILPSSRRSQKCGFSCEIPKFLSCAVSTVCVLPIYNPSASGTFHEKPLGKTSL